MRVRGPQNGSCKHQHHCKGGLDCDEEFCQLLHPSENSRWVVFSDRTHHWAVPMTIDEAIHYAGADGMAALTTHADCTNADVWRASMKAVAYGRKGGGSYTCACAGAGRNACAYRCCACDCHCHACVCGCYA